MSETRGGQRYYDTSKPIVTVYTEEDVSELGALECKIKELQAQLKAANDGVAHGNEVIEGLIDNIDDLKTEASYQAKIGAQQFEAQRVEIETLEDELKTKKELLQKYGHHITAPRCSWFDIDGLCDCGFEQVMKDLDK